jgi:biopolymer transport protein ExbD
MAFGNRSSSQEAMSEINVTPLVDVMLVLLVVFIVTAPLLTQSVKVNLPRTVATSPSTPDQPTTVNINAAGIVSLNDKSEPITLETLATELAALAVRNGDALVQFNADAGVPYGKVAEVMAIAQKAGISRLAFLTRDR